MGDIADDHEDQFLEEYFEWRENYVDLKRLESSVILRSMIRAEKKLRKETKCTVPLCGSPVERVVPKWHKSTNPTPISPKMKRKRKKRKNTTKRKRMTMSEIYSGKWKGVV